MVKENFFYDKQGSFNVEHNNIPIQFDENKLSFIFTAPSDYLGTIFFDFKDNLDGKGGKVIFRIEGLDINEPPHTNEYQIPNLISLKQFPLGFPVYENSKDKRIAVELEAVNNNFKQSLIERGKIELISKYDIPKDKIYTGEYSVFLIIIKKFQFLFGLRTFWLNFVLYSVFMITLTLILIQQISRYNDLKLQSKSRIYIFVIIFSLFYLVFNIFFVQEINSIFYFGYLFALLGVTYYLDLSSNIYKVNLLFLLLSIFILYLFGNFSAAKNAGSWVWGLITSYLMYMTIRPFKIDALTNKLRFVKSSSKTILMLIFIFLLVLSTIDKTYTLGGDDTRMFYLFPEKFIKYFSVNSISDNAISGIYSYATQSHWIPFVSVILILKKLLFFVNIQVFLYLANYFLGIYFFYRMMEVLLGVKLKNSKLFLISGFFYVFSIFNAFTTYDAQLVNMYLISIFPLCVFLFITSIEKKEIRYILLIGLLTSIFSVVMISIPWIMAMLIAISPFLIFYFLKDKTTFLKHTMILAVVFIAMNIFWLLPLLQAALINDNVFIGIQSAVSLDTAVESKANVISLVSKNNVFYPMINLFLYNIQKANNWPYLNIFKDWYLNLLPFNIMLIGLIIVAGLVKHKTAKLIKYYFLALISLLISIYFFTVNITKFGISFFNLLISYIPGFISFRNMYGKFGIAISFSYAILISITLTLLFNNIKKGTYKKLILFGFTFIVFLNSAPYIFGQFGRTPLWTTNSIYKTIHEINSDYLDLVNYAANDKGVGKYLMLPLNYGNTMIIEDESWDHHYYTGVSPFLVLSGKNDYSGILSFSNFGNFILDDINSGNYVNAAEWFRKFNVEYIVIQNSIPPDLISSYYYQTGLYYAQSDEFYKLVTGEHIKDFGNRYSLYRINDNYKNKKLFFANNKNVFPDSFDKLGFTKVNNNKYKINFNIKDLGEYLIFLDPYHDGWKIYDKKDREILGNAHTIAFDYANAWKLDRDELSKNYNGEEEIELTLYFEPQKQINHLTIISLSSGVLIGLYLIYAYLIKDRKWRK